MKRKTSLKLISLLLIGVCVVGPMVPLLADQPVATWHGRQYTGPVCSNLNCPMCYGPNGIVSQINRQRVSTPAIAQDDEFEYVTKYRTETVQRCNGRRGAFRRCWTETIQVPYTVKVRKASVSRPVDLKALESWKAKLSPTPQDALVSLFLHLGPIMGRQTLIDAGSGDGRVIEEASRAGFVSLGVEIDGDLVEAVRKRFKALEIDAEVIEGDALKFDYSAADVIYLYQFPDFMKEILDVVDRSRDRKIVSYMHEIPGVDDAEKFTTGGHVFYIGTLKAKSKVAALDFEVLTFSVAIGLGESKTVKVDEPFLAKGKQYAIRELTPITTRPITVTRPRISRTFTRTVESNRNRFPIMRRIFRRR